jgi:hypothetical protein
MQDQNSNSVELSREDKIMNTIVNTSILLMSTLMGGFSELMVNVTSELASGMTEAFAGEKSGKEAREKVKEKLPEVNDKMRAMISDMRKDIYLQMEKKHEEIAPFMTDPVFDLGPQKVDTYDFGLPKLTSRLDDNTLAQYSYLLVNEDAKFVELFSQIMDWLNSLPKAPKDTENK